MVQYGHTIFISTQRNVILSRKSCFLQSKNTSKCINHQRTRSRCQCNNRSAIMRHKRQRSSRRRCPCNNLVRVVNQTNFNANQACLPWTLVFLLVRMFNFEKSKFFRSTNLRTGCCRWFVAVSSLSGKICSILKIKTILIFREHRWCASTTRWCCTWSCSWRSPSSRWAVRSPSAAAWTRRFSIVVFDADTLPRRPRRWDYDTLRLIDSFVCFCDTYSTKCTIE